MLGLVVVDSCHINHTEQRAPLAACLDGEALASAGAGPALLLVVEEEEVLLVVVVVVVVEEESIERKSKLSMFISMARAGRGEEPEEQEAGATIEPTPESIPYKRSPILVAAEEGGGGRGGGG